MAHAPPPFAKPLAPYIKSRKEALHIRRALTQYLKAQIAFSDDLPASHISLCDPHNVSAVKQIPPELSSKSLRGEYLKALQENIAARKDYDQVVEQVAERNHEASSAAPDGAGNEPDFQAYLALLRSRRELGKLKIFQHYLDQLNAREAAQQHYLALDKEQTEPYRSPQALPSDLNPESGTNLAPEADVESLVHELEKEVLRAHRRVGAEKSLLEKLKARRQATNRDPAQGAVSSGAKLKALSRTRYELVAWVEKMLARTTTNERAPTEDLTDGVVDEEAVEVLNEAKIQIQEQYDSYVEARKELLLALSAATQPLANEITKKDPSAPEPQTVETNHTTTDIGLIFQYISEVLLPLSNAQKAAAVQKSYLSAMMSKGKTDSCRILEKLQEESHLLPEYPILARQPRFKHAVAAISSRSLAHNASSEQSGSSEMVVHAETWAFASKEARNAASEYIDAKTEYGEEMAHNAEGTLREIYEIMNQDYDEVTTGGKNQDEDDGGDIWAAETGLGRNRKRHARSGRAKGPWSGLNGKVGVAD